MKLVFNKWLPVIFAFAFCPLLLQAQNENDRKKRYKNSLTLLYGQNIYRKTFSPSLNTFQNYNGPGATVNFVGIKLTGFLFGIGSYSYDGSAFYTQLIPSVVKLTDSTTATLNGFNFTMDLFKIRFFKKSKVVVLQTELGFTTGRVRLRSSEIRQKNPYFSPHLAIYNGYRPWKKWEFGFTVAYAYDISRSGWKRMFNSDKNQSHVNNFAQSMFFYNLAVGFKW